MVKIIKIIEIFGKSELTEETKSKLEIFLQKFSARDDVTLKSCNIIKNNKNDQFYANIQCFTSKQAIAYLKENLKEVANPKDCSLKITSIEGENREVKIKLIQPSDDIKTYVMFTITTLLNTTPKDSDIRVYSLANGDTVINIKRIIPDSVINKIEDTLESNIPIGAYTFDHSIIM